MADERRLQGLGGVSPELTTQLRQSTACTHAGQIGRFGSMTAATAAFQVPPPPLSLAAARQRAKLWDLNGSIHCSIIGTCLTTGELRRAMGRFAKGDIAHLSDHDLHAEAVGLCGHHNPGAKLLHKTLDQRHLVAVKQFSRLQGEPAVMAKWREARLAGDIPGAYWAVLTHPDVGAAGIRQAFGDVHMLSHLIGSANRADVKRLAVLEAEKETLLDKVQRQQVRLCQAVTSRDATIRRLSGLAAERAAACPKPGPEDEQTALHHLVAELHGKLAAETARCGRMEARLAAASDTSRVWEVRATAAERDREALLCEVRTLEENAQPPDDCHRIVALSPERVLYVGGRPGTVEQARDALAAAGGELLAHDGGQHDSPAQLAGLVGRADRVVFPVDCVSHDAALTVKRLCRQLGKPWLPLRSSGLASFLSAVAG